jgi:hypothetical protein
MLASRWGVLAQSTLLSITVSAWAIPGISEEQMQQKSKGSANDPEAVKTEPSPEKGHGVPIPKRGAFPTPKAIIESSPQYTPEGSGTTGGESVTKPVSSTNAEKSGVNGAK